MFKNLFKFFLILTILSSSSFAAFGTKDAVKNFLKYAAQGNFKKVRKALKSKKLDANKVDENGNTALILSIKNNHILVFNELIKSSKVDLNKSNNKKEFPLLLARKDHTLLLTLLDDKRIRANQKDAKNNNVLMNMILDGKEVPESVILHPRININDTGCNYSNCKTFTLATRVGKYAEQTSLIMLKRKDLNVNYLVDDHMTSIEYLLEYAPDSIIKGIINHPSFDVNFRASKFHSIPSTLLNFDKLKLAKKLISDPKFKPIPGGDLLTMVIARGDLNLIKKVLNFKSIEINRESVPKEELYELPLISAIERGDLEILELLLSQKNIDLNKPLNSKYYPIHAAIDSGNIELIKRFISDTRFELDTYDNQFKHPIEYAMNENKSEIIDLLLSNDQVNFFYATRSARRSQNGKYLKKVLNHEKFNLLHEGELGYYIIEDCIEDLDLEALKELVSLPQFNVNQGYSKSNRTILFTAFRNTTKGKKAQKILKFILDLPNIDPHTSFLDDNGMPRKSIFQLSIDENLKDGFIAYINHPKVNINIRIDEKGNTPLLLNLTNLEYNYYASEALVNSDKLDINYKNSEGYNALMLLLKLDQDGKEYHQGGNNYIEFDLYFNLVKTLFKRQDLEINATNNNGESAFYLSMANDFRNKKLVSLFLSNEGVDLNQITKSKESLLSRLVITWHERERLTQMPRRLNNHIVDMKKIISDPRLNFQPFLVKNVDEQLEFTPLWELDQYTEVKDLKYRLFHHYENKGYFKDSNSVVLKMLDSGNFKEAARLIRIGHDTYVYNEEGISIDTYLRFYPENEYISELKEAIEYNRAQDDWF